MDLFYRNRILWLVLVSVLLISGIIYAYQDIQLNTFHLDDFDNIVSHQPIRIDEFSVTALLNAGNNGFLVQRYLPNVSFAIDWWRGDGQAEAFLSTNLFLHCLASLAFFLLLHRIFSLVAPNQKISFQLFSTLFLVTLLWSVHPLQTQSVTYVVQRMTTMAALFTVLSLLTYMQWRLSVNKKYIWAFLFIVSCIAAVFSKENAYIIPVLLILTEYGVFRHKKTLINHYRDWLILLSLGVLSILIILDLFNTSGFIHSLYQGTYQYRDFTLYERLLTQPRVTFFHLSQFFWPVPARFSIEHSVVISQSILSPMTTLYSILALLAWIALGIALMLTQHFRLWGYFILWIPSTLAIESSFVPLEMVFEHRMYLPLFGLIGLIAMVFRWMLGMQSAHQWATKFLYLGLCFFIFVSCWATRQRLPDWRTKITLLESAVDNAANSDRLWGNLSTYYYKDGQINKSIQAAQKTLRLNPDNSDALETMGVIFIDRNQLVRAEEKLRSALMQKPHSSGFNHWGELKLKQGQPEEAMTSFLKAIELSPWIANYHWNVALTYEQLNRCRHSRQHWLEYIRLADGDLVGIQDVNQHLKEEYNQPNGKCFSK